MIYYICDNCNKVTVGDPEVKLKGISGTSGGILLPEKYIEKHFCCPTCFWRWSIKYNPLTPEKQRQKEIDKLKRLKQIRTLEDNDLIIEDEE